jgi:hypothetical protein
MYYYVCYISEMWNEIWNSCRESNYISVWGAGVMFMNIYVCVNYNKFYMFEDCYCYYHNITYNLICLTIPESNLSRSLKCQICPDLISQCLTN